MLLRRSSPAPRGFPHRPVCVASLEATRPEDEIERQLRFSAQKWSDFQQKVCLDRVGYLLKVFVRQRFENVACRNKPVSQTVQPA